MDVTTFADRWREFIPESKQAEFESDLDDLAWDYKRQGRDEERGW